MIDVEKLKDRVSIEDVLVACGARPVHSWSGGWTENQMIFCPFHPDINTPAGSMNLLKGLYFCFACDAKGDIVSLARLHLEQEGEDSSFRAACEWLESLAEEG